MHPLHTQQYVHTLNLEYDGGVQDSNRTFSLQNFPHKTHILRLYIFCMD